ncbi:Putative G3BP-like protein [Auxenochlorella protothecoides]|uniref:Putative G3BP-like protein n=1 Tax=Auxenochlorella protothecoides TaxID=3075 RepID=A0A087SPQ5_AUXPR|nr:Putative G3BP-like protein [Auxenochlorella protothecoides]KFM27709.1 Putative G3BP-like protein [Auxenochlorella protothecoides]
MSRTGFAPHPAPGTFLPQVTSQFVQQFYTVLHQSPKQLHRFYADSSIFSVANVAGDGLVHTAVGQRAIYEAVQRLGFEEAVTEIYSVDSQPSAVEGVVVQVSGTLQSRGKPKRPFVQTFFLAVQEKGYYVLNDIFRFLPIGLTNLAAAMVPAPPVRAPIHAPPADGVAGAEEPAAKAPAGGVVEAPSAVSAAALMSYADRLRSAVGDAARAEAARAEAAGTGASEPGLPRPASRPSSRTGATPSDGAPVADGAGPDGARPDGAKAPRGDSLSSTSSTASAGQGPSASGAAPAGLGAAPASVATDSSGGSAGPNPSVFIRDIPPAVKLEQLVEALTAFGPLRPNGVKLKQQRGRDSYAFVDFVSPDASAAILSQGLELEGRAVTIAEKRAQPYFPTMPGPGPAGYAGVPGMGLGGGPLAQGPGVAYPGPGQQGAPGPAGPDHGHPGVGYGWQAPRGRGARPEYGRGGGRGAGPGGRGPPRPQQ